MSNSNKNYRSIAHDRNKNFNDVIIHVDHADVVIARAEDDRCKVLVCENKEAPNVVTRTSEALSVVTKDDRGLVKRIFSSKKADKITILLPQSSYRSLYVNIKSGSLAVSGGLSFENLEAAIMSGNLNLNAEVTNAANVDIMKGNLQTYKTTIGELTSAISSGEIILDTTRVAGNIETSIARGNLIAREVVCGSISSDVANGKNDLTGLVAEESMSLSIATGKIILDGCDAKEIHADVAVGDISGSLLSDKIFTAKAGVGKVNVPTTADGGRCNAKVSVGSIDLKIK